MTRSSSAPFIAFMLSLLLPLRGEDGVIEVPFEETSDFFLDPGALNGKCLAASLLTDTGTLFELESPELPSGAYRVHIRLKVSHTISEHTSRLAFQLAAQNPANQFRRELTIIAFERPGRYQDFSIPILIDDRAITLVPAGEQASLWEIAMKLAKQDNGMKAIISQLGP